MKEIFSNNLKKARALMGWTQEKAAAAIGVKPKTYGAWEEGRGFPTEEVLITLAREMQISDLLGFISNESFDVKAQIISTPPTIPSLVAQKYKQAGIREKLAVNILLGLVDLDEKD